jgi:hypothetical protein
MKMFSIVSGPFKSTLLWEYEPGKFRNWSGSRFSPTEHGIRFGKATYRGAIKPVSEHEWLRRLQAGVAFPPWAKESR